MASYATTMIDGTVNQNCMTVEATDIDEALKIANDTIKASAIREPDVTNVTIYGLDAIEDPRF